MGDWERRPLLTVAPHFVEWERVRACGLGGLAEHRALISVVPQPSSNLWMLPRRMLCKQNSCDSSIKHCSQYLFLSKFILVFLLDGLNLETVVLELLSNFLALLQVVETVLLLEGRVLGNLGADHVGVVAQLVLAFVLHFALLLLVFLLAVD